MIKTGDTVKIKNAKASESFLLGRVGVVDHVIRSIMGDVAVVHIRIARRMVTIKVSVDDLEILEGDY